MSTSSDPWTVPTVTSSTNLGPLLTPLTLPSDCLSKIWDFGTPGIQPAALTPLDAYFTQGCAISSCCPSSAPYSEAYQWLTTYYSPAVCPVSYKNCAGPTNLTPSPSETIVFCCPANYDCPSSFQHWWACLFTSPIVTVVYEIDTVYTQETVSTKVGSISFNVWAVAYPIQIRWQQEDLASFSSAAMQITTETSSSTETQPASTSSTAAQNTSSFSSAAMQITTETSSSTQTQPVSTSSTAAQNTSGVSIGVEAGIGIGVGTIFVVIIVAAIFWVRRKGHRRNELDGMGVVRKPEIRVGATPIEADSNNVGAPEHNSLNNPNELEGGRVCELAGG